MLISQEYDKPKRKKEKKSIHFFHGLSPKVIIKASEIKKRM